MSRRRMVRLVLISAGLAAAAVVLLLPVVEMRRDDPTNRGLCRAKLRELLRACQVYAGDNDGALPDSLERLYPDYVDDPALFECPSARRARRGRGPAAAGGADCGYALEPGLCANMPGGFILLRDRSVQNHAADGFNAAYLDGRVEWLNARSDVALQAHLARQRQALEACARDGQPPPADPARLKPVDLQKRNRP